jgi:hypothetical protein
MVEVVLALGNMILITLGFASVLAIKKKSKRKNMMSFNDDDSTSASSLCLLRKFMFK